jgi:hypothetical protein
MLDLGLSNELILSNKQSNGDKGENAFQKNPTITRLTRYALMADQATIECSHSIFSTTRSSSFSISC